jgi:pimeloyl-ACP methyl ester carboxylesterase
MIRPTRQKWRRWLIGTWSWKRPLKSLAFIYGCLFLVAVFFTEKLLFFPPSPSYEETSEIIKLKTKSGNTIAAIDRPSKAGFPTLLYTHGNAEDLGDVFGMADAWQNEGFGVMAYDFPGYGRSSGTPLESTCEEAIEAAWSHLTISKGIAPSRIIIVGRSVGSGPSVWLAERKSPAGLILISPFTSVFAVRIPVPIFPYDRFPSLKRIPQVQCPLLVIHGEEDTLISASHGRRLVDAPKVADQKFLGIPGAGHNDLFEVGGGDVELAVQNFVLRVSPPQPAAGN